MFTKMAGGGNDFVVVDLRHNQIDDPSELAVKVCTRRLSIGADGLILVEPGDTTDVRMLYFNADGSRAEFCANGTRCAARFSYLEGMAGKIMRIEADCGVIPAEICDDGKVELEIALPEAEPLRKPLELEDGTTVDGIWLEVGVPHYVISVEDSVWDLHIDDPGRQIRHHPELQPKGANVNFVHTVDDSTIHIRTWERGVEGETLSCGSGVTASVAVGALNGSLRSPVTVRTRSGISYIVRFERTERGLGPLRLEGDARVVFRSELSTETIGGFDAGWVREPSDREPVVD